MNYSHNNTKTWPDLPELKNRFKVRPKPLGFWDTLDLSEFKPTKSKQQYSLLDEYAHPMTNAESAKVIKFTINRVLKALPTDNARLFFLQSELIAPEFKEFKQDMFYYPKNREYEYGYYCEVQRQLKSLKEKTHGK